MNDEPTLKQYNFLNGKGKWVEGMTKQEAHAAISQIIPSTDKPVPKVPNTKEDMLGDMLEKVGFDTSKPVLMPKKEYALTDGNIRIGALNATITAGGKPEHGNFWDVVGIFEDYIRNGQSR